MPTDFSSALARLLKDAELRRRFRDDPAATVDELLSEPSDRAALLEVDPDQLDEQAEGLVRKRFTEVAKLLPRSMASLGASAFSFFSEHAANFWPEGRRRHIDDAASFARYLRRRGVSAACEAELNAAIFAGGERLVAVRLSRIIVGRRRRRALQILFRHPRPTRQIFFYLGALG